MKKVVVLILSGSLLAMPLPNSTAASPKAGATCAKLNQKQISGDFKYICIKTGKRLTWSKGVLSPKFPPTLSPTPTPKPTLDAKPTDGDTPLPLINCTYGTYYYRYQNDTLQRSFYADSGYKETDSRDNSLFDPVQVEAYSAIRNHRSQKPITSLANIHLAPSFPKVEFQFLQNELNSAIQFYSDKFSPNEEIQATFMTEQDRSSLDLNNLSSTGGDETKWISDTYLDVANQPWVKCGWRNGIAGSHMINFGRNMGQIGYWIVFPSFEDETAWNPENLFHEFTHGIQDKYWSRGTKFDLQTQAYNLIEGGGYLIGNALGYSKLGWYSDEINKKIASTYLGDSNSQFIPRNNADILVMLEKSEVNDNKSGTQWAYTAGAHLWEWLIAKYGYDAYWNLVENVTKYPTYDQAIFATIGISKAELYSEAAPYILKQFRIALREYIK